MTYPEPHASAESGGSVAVDARDMGLRRPGGTHCDRCSNGAALVESGPGGMIELDWARKC